MSNQITLCAVKQYARVDKLKIHPNNPRTISRERLDQLKMSIINKGFYEPILVWKKGLVVLSGNHRLMAVRELIADGFEFNSPNGEANVLPVIIEDVPYKVAESILFEANNHYSEWIESKLKEAVQEAQKHGSNVKEFGFNEAELKRLLRDAEKEAEDFVKREKKESKKIEKELKKELLDVEPEFTSPELDADAMSASYTTFEDSDEYGYITLPKKQIDQLNQVFERARVKLGYSKEESLTLIVPTIIKILNEALDS